MAGRREAVPRASRETRLHVPGPCLRLASCRAEGGSASFAEPRQVRFEIHCGPPTTCGENI